jgi:hypothetical protein
MIRHAPIFILGIALALAASCALFVAMPYITIYVAGLRGQFYTPIPNPSFLDYVRSLSLLRFALWPFLTFLVLQCGSAFAISKLFRVEGSSMRVLAGSLVSLAITIACLVVLWASFGRLVRS